MPTCSVVMPVRNGEQFVAEAIESLLTQTVRPSEIIITDDGSTDRTPEILRSHGTAVQVVTLSGSGASAARNAGIRTATGELVAFLDSDDICLPGRLEKQIQALESDTDAGGSEAGQSHPFDKLRDRSLIDLRDRLLLIHFAVFAYAGNP